MIRCCKKDYCIVIDDACGETVYNAAEFLRKIFFEAIGFSPEIIRNSKNIPTRGIISLGNTYFFKQERNKFNLKGLGDDGFILKTVGKNIFIVANNERGVLYGVYELAECGFGVRFLSDDETYIPKNQESEFPVFSKKEVPAFANRVYLCGAANSGNPEYSSVLRMNNEWVNMPKKYGGRLKMIGGHGTLNYVPPEKYAKEHPEWYFEKDNKIIDICYSHVGLNSDGSVNEALKESPVKIAIEKLYEEVISPENSDIEYFMIGQEDTYSVLMKCDCDDCLTQSDYFGRSGMLIRFINALSRGVKKKLKENRICRRFNLVTLAYQWSENPPWDFSNNKPLDKSVVPDKNVFVRLATANSKNYYGLIDKSQISSVRNMYAFWHKLTKNLMTWNYCVDFGGYLIYYPTLQHWKNDLTLMKEQNFCYVLFQGGQTERHLWQDRINVYVASKMMWNPSRNPYLLRDEFVSLYYKGAEKFVFEFIQNMNAKYNEFLGNHVPILDRPSTRINGVTLLNEKLYSKEFWEKQLRLLDKAIDCVQKSSLGNKDKLILKILEIKLTPLYMVAMKYNEYYGENETKRQLFLKEFFDICERVGLREYKEGYGIGSLKERLKHTV